MSTQRRKAMSSLTQQTRRSVPATASTGPAAALRADVAAALERLSQIVVTHPSPALQEAMRFIDQVAASWHDVSEDALPARGAGFGSAVQVEDMDLGGRETLTLMAGPLLDFDAGQVSLGSPMGHALLGCDANDVVTVRTPQRVRTLRVVAVRTLRDRLAEHESVPAA
jgi:transcription elongation GreA/GreB family factor